MTLHTNTSRISAVLTALALLGTGSLLGGTGTAAPAEQFAAGATSSMNDAAAAEGTGDTCDRPFTYGTGVAGTTVCFSNDGTLVQFAAAPNEQIRNGVTAEGYMLCDRTSGTNYYDFTGIEAGWADPVVSQPNGAGKFPLTITRRTTDGVWELVQTYAFSNPNGVVTMVMKATNRSTTKRTAFLMRFADVDADNSTTNDLAGKSLNSAWIHKNTPNGQGLMLTSATPNQARATSVKTFNAYPTDCTTPSEATPSTVAQDWMATLNHALGTLSPGAGRGIKMRYELI